jgi:hypothetical protein
MDAPPPPPPEPFDPTMQEELDGISFSWNTWPTTRIEASRTVVPIGAIYTPLKSRPADLPPVDYPPVVCKCKVILNPFCGIDIASKTWTCQVYFTLLFHLQGWLADKDVTVLSFSPTFAKLLFQHSTRKYAFGITTSIYYN